MKNGGGSGRDFTIRGERKKRFIRIKGGERKRGVIFDRKMPPCLSTKKNMDERPSSAGNS